MNENLKDLKFKVYTTQIEKTGSSGERRLIRGYASVGDVLDRQNEVITLGALVKAREDLLKNHTIFYEHKHSELPIGKTIAVDLDEKGLLITVEISKAPHVDPVWTLIQEGILNSFSIGGRVMEAEERRDKAGNLFNEITQIELFETSVVGLPANPAAKFELISKSFGMAITEEMKKREVSNMSEKETKKEVEVEIITDATETTTGNQNTAEVEITKSEEVETEKSEEATEEKVEKSEEANEEATEEKEEVIEKSEEAEEVVEVKEPVIAKSEETREDKKARLLKEIEDIDAEEEAEKEANAEETTSSEEESSEEVSEELPEVPEVKSTDELILEKLSILIDKFEDKEVEEVEVEEIETETEKSEEVSTEEAPVEELAVAKSEEKEDLEKVVKIEDAPKEEAKEETPVRKGEAEVIIAEAPYSNGEETTKATKAQLDLVKAHNWKTLIFGDK